MKTLAREFYLSFWKVHILHHAAKQPIYGQWMLEELREHGYSLSPGTLYPILQRMEQRGWLRSVVGGSGPSSRKCYRLTPAGQKILQALRRQISELHHEVVKESGVRTTKVIVSKRKHPR
ncbi:MAG: PadR family transcriptional regulator [Candidatus Sumerlaeaceae bacterium]|nr:PadR family transcriptional regulator [Candidatus Sumerlaeaceae bacterium]